ncbi:maleylacetoacetate isomerase, partial [Patescibacteria group bacterium]
EKTWNVPQAEREAWTRHWISVGFEALEKTFADNPSTGGFCEGDTPTLADCCLIPQVYNAIRFGVDLKPYPTVRRIYEGCMALPEFEAARPENQPDAPASSN